MILFDAFTNGVVDAASGAISTFTSPAVGTLASLFFNGFLNELGSRDKAEYIAYNWYYLLFIWNSLF